MERDDEPAPLRLCFRTIAASLQRNNNLIAHSTRAIKNEGYNEFRIFLKTNYSKYTHFVLEQSLLLMNSKLHFVFILICLSLGQTKICGSVHSTTECIISEWCKSKPIIAKNIGRPISPVCSLRVKNQIGNFLYSNAPTYTGYVN